MEEFSYLSAHSFAAVPAIYLEDRGDLWSPLIQGVTGVTRRLIWVICAQIKYVFLDLYS